VCLQVRERGTVRRQYDLIAGYWWDESVGFPLVKCLENPLCTAQSVPCPLSPASWYQSGFLNPVSFVWPSSSPAPRRQVPFFPCLPPGGCPLNPRRGPPGFATGPVSRASPLFAKPQPIFPLPPLWFVTCCNSFRLLTDVFR